MTSIFLQTTNESWLHKLKHAQVRMSNDNDGVVASSLLRYEKGWETTQFYNYEILALNDNNNAISPIVAVDCGVTSKADFYTLDNHVGLYSKDSIVNPNSINLNLYNQVTPNNYTDKFAMSTTLLTWVALGKKLPNTVVGKMILIALDGGHKGYYSNFQEQYIRNLEQLGVKDELLPILENHTEDDFKIFLKEKLRTGMDTVHLILGEGELWVNEKMYAVYELISNELGFSVELPKGEFITIEEFDKRYAEIDVIGDLSKREDVQSWAFYNSKKVSYSVKLTKRKQKAGF